MAQTAGSQKQDLCPALHLEEKAVCQMLETGQDKALKGAGKEYVCIFGILGVWICNYCS